MKNCFITGGGSGLGKELALLYSQKGFHIHLASRNMDKLTSAKKEIEASGGQATIYSIDVQKPQAIEELAAAFQKDNQQIDLFINNAGVGIFGPFSSITMEDIETTFAVNVYAPILLTKAFLPLLSSNSTVINIISTAGLRGKKHESLYCASKFALRGFTESLQKEYENDGPRFVAAYMGGMNTPFWDHSDHVKNPAALPHPKQIAERIAQEAEEQLEIIIER
ncbi:SDR family NAD(P)-dependent oxidoreductase [Pseudobacillus wudalianchiensis]|uniref:Short-chain dehydrogenase n=1 Tax=Pseudobacillus wudalianchiensis TaxID=1743143 RepID=A0A1B9AFX9_9BACI|nr:SDR family oxidoreductase [Bacillus wudalianchiensis]OCA82744.1 short-chain dehydrogenase [Bacillus wudalianchiensis]